MAKVGLKYIVFAPITERPAKSRPVYGTGVVVGKAISADFEVSTSEGKLFADDILAEYQSQFQGGTLTLGVDDLSHEVQVAILGNKLVTEGGKKVLKKGAQNSPPHGGCGFIKTRVKNSKRTFIVRWILDIAFHEPNDSTETKGDTITFQTPKVEGTFMPVEGYGDDDYVEEVEFDTYDDAEAWLNTQANISTASGASVASVSAPARTTGSTSSTTETTSLSTSK